MKPQEKAKLEGMFVYQGFLFGHYDSRGGSSLIEGDNLTEVMDRYVEMMWTIPKSDDMFKNIRDGIEEELIGKAILVSPVELKYLDLESDGEALVQNIPGAEEDAFLPEINKRSKLVIEYVPKGKKLRILRDVIHPRWDDDAYGLVFIGKNLSMDEYIKQNVEDCREKIKELGLEDVMGIKKTS